MRYIINQHFRLNRILLLAIGLWPYQQSLLVRFQQIFLIGILASFVVFQLTVLLTSKCTLDFVIKIFSSTFFAIIFIVKYNSFWINSQNVKNALEELQSICNELKDENEITIMKKYGNSAERYTVKIIAFAMCSLFIFFCLPMWPRICDIVLPLNESRSRLAVHVLIEYFVDQEKYYYLIVLHINVALSIGAAAIISTGTLLIAHLKHACGMFTIASYRIKKVMTINNLQNSLKNEIVIYKGIIYAVNIHCKAIELSKSLISNLEGSYLSLIGVGVICLSLNLFEMYQTLSIENNKEEFLLHFVIVVVVLLYMFLGNYAGQEIIDHNNHIFCTAYTVRWYLAPLHIQKLILFLLQRRSKDVNLILGGIFAASLKTFATLTSASISYFTFIHSTHE